MNPVHFSSKTDLWATPQDFFDVLNAEFGFVIDVCATAENTKCRYWLGKDANEGKGSLSMPWWMVAGLYTKSPAPAVWMNPPYGREIGKWVKKAYEESLKGATVVCLLPARTDTKWFHAYIQGKAEVRFVKGRLKFGGAKNSAPFPSMVVVFRGTK